MSVGVEQPVDSTSGYVSEEEILTPSIAPSLTYSEDSEDQDELQAPEETPRRRRASTRLIAKSPADVQRITGESTQQLLNRCCGGGCCMNEQKKEQGIEYERVPLPDNDAFSLFGLED